jgi:hypothetical protein
MKIVIRILRQVKSRDEFKFKPQVQQLLETRLEIGNFFQGGFMFRIHSFHSLKFRYYYYDYYLLYIVMFVGKFAKNRALNCCYV